MTEAKGEVATPPNGRKEEVKKAIADFPFEIYTPNKMSEWLKILIYAAPGAGKTYLLGTAEGDERLTPALLVDTEGGTLTIRGTKDIDVVRIRNYSDMVTLIQHLREPDHSKCSHRKWKSVMVDSLTELQKQIMGEIVRTEYQNNPSGRDPDVPTMRDWGKNAERVRKVIRALRDMPGYHLFITCLEKENKDDNTGTTITLPSLPGQLAHEIAGFIDIVGYLRVMREETQRGEGQKQIRTYRRLIVQPITKAIAKDRSDLLGEWVDDPTLPKLLDVALAEMNKDGSKKKEK